MKYTQNNEEEHILRHFDGRPAGRFMDIGAFAAMDLSNTRALVERGWKGVMVEPSPVPFTGLLKAYGSTAGIELVNAAVTDGAPGLVEWFDSGGDAISTTVTDHRDKWAASGIKYTRSWVYMMPMSALFDRFGFDFDFLSLDVESANFQLFTALPLDRLERLRMIVIEHDNQWQEMLRRASPHGYSLVAINGENLILSR